MPQREFTPTGAPCWVDLLTSDPDRAGSFYGQIFGWTAEQGGEEHGGYITFFKNGEPIAGGMQNTAEIASPDVWAVYLSTSNAQATADAAVTHGGRVLVPPMRILDQGTMTVLGDAGEAAIGAWQPDAHKGFGLVGESGTPCWFELRTRAYEASVKFYVDVFHWEAHVMSDSADFRYTTLGENSSAMAGIMDAAGHLPEGTPGKWSIYFGVENTDATLAKVEALGGSITMPAEDSPHGRLAEAADPTGALFKIVSVS